MTSDFMLRVKTLDQFHIAVNLFLVLIPGARRQFEIHDPDFLFLYDQTVKALGVPEAVDKFLLAKDLCAGRKNKERPNILAFDKAADLGQDFLGVRRRYMQAAGLFPMPFAAFLRDYFPQRRLHASTRRDKTPLPAPRPRKPQAGLRIPLPCRPKDR